MRGYEFLTHSLFLSWVKETREGGRPKREKKSWAVKKMNGKKEENETRRVDNFRGEGEEGGGLD